ncbi:hypothetical protein PCLA_09r0017 [Pseudomonas citronellolis]|nr:hypothetical protein PCLA_09r0017 [Pseudomonas citronellolis]
MSPHSLSGFCHWRRGRRSGKTAIKSVCVRRGRPHENLRNRGRGLKRLPGPSRVSGFTGRNHNT